ncbi:MAG TPA: ATP-binding protein [Symbiobacteriaceae bacterium]|nr:ATP-binding protein [Symbiobacteriaceae bacterium]
MTTLDPFPRTPQIHCRFLLFGAVLRLVARVRRWLGAEAFGAWLERYPFLEGYLAEVARLVPGSPDQAERWETAWSQHVQAWAGGATSPLPLQSLSALGPDALMVLMLTGLVEEDSRFGSLYLELQGTGGGRRPTVEVIGRLAANLARGERGWDVIRPLHAAGLLHVTNPTAPRSEWELSVPIALWDAAHGELSARPLPWCKYRPAHELPDLQHLLLPEPALSETQQLPGLTNEIRTIVMRGVTGSQRREALGAVARALGRGVAEVEAKELENEAQRRLLGPFCTLTRAMPVIVYDLAPGDTSPVPELTGYDGVIGVVANLDGGVSSGDAGGMLTVTLPFPGRALRRTYWEQALAGHPGPDADTLAGRFQITGGAIRQIGAMAVSRAALAGKTQVTMNDVLEAGRWLNRQQLDTLATRLEAAGDWSQLVISEVTAARLRDLERRCRYREQLLEHLSPVYKSRGGRGVKAVFHGPSGTGKTLAAVILASVLGMDIYRVDLASVVNKYIGETEKNLSRVLNRAEELDVILLLDEGEALMAKRSDVTSSNDRYANMQTDYLLQRIEHYQGIVLVTTNYGDAIDKAFQRRFDVTVEFQPPQAEERLRIWLAHLPARHGLTPTFLEDVAIRCAMSGGQIRNAALHATLLAVENGRPVAAPDLVEAIRLEYAKGGGLSPLGIR